MRSAASPEATRRLSSEAIPPTTASSVACGTGAAVGGVAALLSRRVIAGETEELTKLIPDILEFVLAPHLGTEGARRIISAG